MNWKPGDRAIIVNVDCHQHMAGEECTLIEYLGYYRNSSTKRFVENAWSVETRAGAFAVASDSLRPIYDGNEPVTWESCVWQPKVLEVVR